MFNATNRMSVAMQAVIVIGAVFVLAMAVQRAVAHLSSDDCVIRNTYDEADNLLTSQTLCR